MMRRTPGASNSGELHQHLRTIQSVLVVDRHAFAKSVYSDLFTRFGHRVRSRHVARRARYLRVAIVAAAQDEFNPEFYTKVFTGTCATGKMQSPVAIVPAHTKRLRCDLVADIRMPVAEKPKVVNVGHCWNVRLLQRVHLRDGGRSRARDKP
jgi:hypothetical protein